MSSGNRYFSYIERAYAIKAAIPIGDAVKLAEVYKRVGVGSLSLSLVKSVSLAFWGTAISDLKIGVQIKTHEESERMYEEHAELIKHLKAENAALQRETTIIASLKAEISRLKSKVALPAHSRLLILLHYFYMYGLPLAASMLICC